jgi:hypothetical protein
MANQMNERHICQDGEGRKAKSMMKIPMKYLDISAFRRNSVEPYGIAEELGPARVIHNTLQNRGMEMQRVNFVFAVMALQLADFLCIHLSFGFLQRLRNSADTSNRGQRMSKKVGRRWRNWGRYDRSAESVEKFQTATFP